MQSRRDRAAPVDPYQLLFQGGQFYLVGYSHERDDVRVFRLSRIRGKVAYATKAEHDFQRPADFDPREYANRIPWQLGDTGRHRRDLGVGPHRLARRAQLRRLRRDADAEDGGRVFRTDYAIPRLLIAWALGYGEHARIARPAGARRRGARAARRDRRAPPRRAVHRASPRARRAGAEDPEADEAAAAARAQEAGDPPRALRPAGHARLRADRRRPRGPAAAGAPRSASSCRSPSRSCARTSRSSTSSTSAAAPTCIYAEVLPTGEIEVDPEPYSDTFDRPARLLPIEANALVAAIEFLGAHLVRATCDSAREKIDRRARRRSGREGLQVARAGADDSDVARDVEPRDRGAPADRARVLRAQRGPLLRRATSSRTR